METELNGYKKSIITEQQRNEQLTMLHNKLLMDMSAVKRHIQTSVQKREQLKTDYSKVRVFCVIICFIICYHSYQYDTAVPRKINMIDIWTFQCLGAG